MSIYEALYTVLRIVDFEVVLTMSFVYELFRARTKMSEISAEISAIFRVSEAN